MFINIHSHCYTGIRMIKFNCVKKNNRKYMYLILLIYKIRTFPSIIIDNFQIAEYNNNKSLPQETF